MARLQTIWACQAGKDVYLEKPGTHNLLEGRQLCEAARKYERMVQHGTQLRSSPKIRDGVRKLQEGLIGDVYMARAISFKFRNPLGKHEPEPVPSGLNWDAWLGPAPMQPYSRFRHGRWRWLWDFSSGDMANQLIHQMDLIRWGAGLDEHPIRVQSMGGHFVHDDDQETPNNQNFACQFQQNNFLLECEHRNWCTPSEAGFRDQYPFIQPQSPVGAIFFGTKGYMLFPDHSSYYTFFGSEPRTWPQRFRARSSDHRRSPFRKLDRCNPQPQCERAACGYARGQANDGDAAALGKRRLSRRPHTAIRSADRTMQRG